MWTLFADVEQSVIWGVRACVCVCVCVPVGTCGAGKYFIITVSFTHA